jgi:hypothetical protein
VLPTFAAGVNAADGAVSTGRRGQIAHVVTAPSGALSALLRHAGLGGEVSAQPDCRNAPGLHMDAKAAPQGTSMMRVWPLSTSTWRLTRGRTRTP